MLKHSPAYIMRKALVLMELAVEPGQGGAPWQAFARREPVKPDDAVTVYNTAPRDLGRTMVDGARVQLYGIQVRVRGLVPDAAEARAWLIADGLDRLYNLTVALAGATYTVRHVSSSGVIDLGAESPQTNRQLFTVNGLASIHLQ